ncbi:unnamed protein product [Pylaiella littoralis]
MAPCNDKASQSNPEEAAATHASLVMDVDFDAQVIQASVEYTVEIMADGASAFVLDTSKLTIGTVTVDGQRARWVQHRRHRVYGSALDIRLPGAEQGAGYAKGHLLQARHMIQHYVKISFCTSPRSTAIQWLPPAQTHGGKRPYLFTQGQAIHSRSLLPCQDCPSVKITYEAKVTVPEWATCLMSALQSDEPRAAEEEEGRKTFSWTQSVPMPSYLIAVAVGELESREISPRCVCRIWSEPGVVDSAAFDFSQTEAFLTTAEGLLGPYEWGRYDVLCLPPSFPYGGMENPCLTFVTPTLLSGDKSLAFVIAHEISHSWTGNLVTNRTWEHFWLNEGWTMWLERNIMTTVTGDPDYYDFDAMEGYRSLRDSVSLFESTGALALTRLVPDLEGVDPDDAFSSVPYEKGFALLNELQRRVGVEAFHAFAKDYIEQFRRSTVDSDEFKGFFLEKFQGKTAELEGFDWDAWFYDAGMPTETPTFNKTLSEESEGLADKWASAAAQGEEKLADAEAAKFEAWTSPQKVTFLQRLVDLSSPKDGTTKTTFSLPLIKAMDEAYGLTETGNSEVRFCWHKLCIRANALFIVPHVLDFVTSMGRMKFTRPLYRELYALGGDTRVTAVNTFKERASFYHPICRSMVAKDLMVDLDEGPRTPKRSLSLASLSMSRTSSDVNFGGAAGGGGSGGIGGSAPTAAALRGASAFLRELPGLRKGGNDSGGDGGGGGAGKWKVAAAVVAVVAASAAVLVGVRKRG